MINSSQDTTTMELRRSLFGRVAGAGALVLAGLTSMPSGLGAAASEADGPNWPGKLKGRHRLVVDAIEVNSGFPLAFAYAFLITNPSPGAATAVIVLRHTAFLMSLNSTMWAKYKIGKPMKLIDPETQAVAVKNPYLNPKPGVLLADDWAIDRLLAGGTLFGACNIALTVLSKKLAGNAGVSAEVAAKEWPRTW